MSRVMEGELLCLKWRDHCSTLFRMLSSVRRKEVYCDATIACDGRFYPVHKFVLSTCSEYFEQMFEMGDQKNLMIVITDISTSELETLLDYMYFGEVNVLQSELTTFMRAAERLKIKGLGAPSEGSQEMRSREKRKIYESESERKCRRWTDEASHHSSQSSDPVDQSDDAIHRKKMSESPTSRYQVSANSKTKNTMVTVSRICMGSPSYSINESPFKETSSSSVLSRTHSLYPYADMRESVTEIQQAMQIKEEPFSIKSEPDECQQSEISDSGVGAFSSPEGGVSYYSHDSSTIAISASRFQGSVTHETTSGSLNCAPLPLPGPSTQTTRKTGRPISDIWNHYRTEKIDGKTYVICIYCTIQRYGYPNATKMKLHTVKCKESPDNVKKQYKKELADIVAKNEANKLQCMTPLSPGCESTGYSLNMK